MNATLQPPPGLFLGPKDDSSVLAPFQQHLGRRGPLLESRFIKDGKWAENSQVAEASHDYQA